MSEREKALRLLRAVRERIDPDVLARARDAAMIQTGQAPAASEVPENEASRLFRMALADGGARRVEVLRLLERKFRHKLN